MSAYGLAERRATAERMKTINAGRSWIGSIDDDVDIPRVVDGKVVAHAVVDFGAPVRSTRDRNLSNPEKGQPHILPGVVTCVAGSADDAMALAAAFTDLLLDWAPSSTSDPFELKGGYGARRAATANTPTRFIQVLYIECVVNQGVEGPF